PGRQPGRRAPHPLPRRADHRARRSQPSRALAARGRAPRPGHHHPAHHPDPRRGRPSGRPGGGARRRARRRRGHAGRAQAVGGCRAARAGLRVGGRPGRRGRGPRRRRRPPAGDGGAPGAAGADGRLGRPRPARPRPPGGPRRARRARHHAPAVARRRLPRTDRTRWRSAGGRPGGGGAVSTPTRPRPAPLAAELTFVGRGLRHSRRNPDALVLALALPVFVMVLFVHVFGTAIDTAGTRYVDNVVPGVILLCAGFGASSTAVGVCEDVLGGTVDRFRTLPVRSAAVLTGHVVASLCRNLVSTALVVGVALALRFRPDATPLQRAAAAGLVVLVVLALTWVSAAVGLVA